MYVLISNQISIIARICISIRFHQNKQYMCLFFRKTFRRKYGHQTALSNLCGREVDEENDGLLGPHNCPRPNIRRGSTFERIHPGGSASHQTGKLYNAHQYLIDLS